jgi:UDPglucose--hexose-1-phosphate uridylyltransferase
LAPHEIFAIRDDSKAWQIRVIPNKFPALRIEEGVDRTQEGKLFHRMGGCGAHEVLIESPDHARFLGHQPIEQVERVLRGIHARFVDLLRDTRMQAIVVFKNHGERAGTSLRHPHWQIISTPVVPRLLRQKHAIAMDYYDRTGRCLYCVILEEERADGRRLLMENGAYAAILPYASHAPFQVRILPRHHESSFASVPTSSLRSLAEVLRGTLARLYMGLGNPDFNLAISAAPRGDEDKRYFLWHIDILPRLSPPAGFELGSGMSINTVLPEEATAFLKGIRIPE